MDFNSLLLSTEIFMILLAVDIHGRAISTSQNKNVSPKLIVWG